MTVQEYIDRVSIRFKTGISTEHTYRGDLQQLIESLVPEVSATNEPKRQKCGAPDYIITKKDIPVGFIEAKDIGDKDLKGTKKTGHKEQFDRYKASLSNLMFTDYLDFHLYRSGELITTIAIGRVVESGKGQVICPLPENFTAFENLIKEFCAQVGQTIKSSKKLAEMMAGKARLLADIIERALTGDAESNEDSTLKSQMEAFKEILIHDITPKGFADVYAQTIAYGMFAARLHDPTLPTFSRQEAAELIPKTNPFLRKLFGYIAGPDIDDRIKWVVDSLVEVFLACDVAELLQDYGRATKMEDPIIHFYETFLAEYDPKLRKARGVWYTPQPVVNFIVRAVDDILKTEFGLKEGLADKSKTTIKVDMQGKKVAQEVHRVQILDPATGTGTFLAEVVKHIHKKFDGQQGIWNSYVEENLIPRLNGFELLMASYAMAHLKLDILLRDTGYKAKKEQRLRVYLTNSLEEHHPDTGTLFANWLSTEANEANRIKRDAPVMCVIGNPPYSVSSTNKGAWIEGLTADYKKDLNERNIQPLSDDYIKFIRYGQHYIEKNGEGVLAYISNNSFLDGLIHRQMRKHLLETFDKIYIVDLHGNAKKQESAPDGGKDENVFDIMQGVSINLFVKNGTKKKGVLAEVYHSDMYGKRELKYTTLANGNLKSVSWSRLEVDVPNYFFVKKDFEGSFIYKDGFKLDEFFIKNASGIKTERDSLTVQFNDDDLRSIKNDLVSLEPEEFRKKHTPKPDGRDWKVVTAKEDLIRNKSKYVTVLYRPFDFRRTIYTGKSKGFHSYPRNEIMSHLLKDNFAIITTRQTSTFDYQHIFVSHDLVDMCTISLQTKETSYVFPLYLYETNNNQTPFLDSLIVRVPNLKSHTIRLITEKIGIGFSFEKDIDGKTFAPIDILDYIYAVLHSPKYRETYKEFLKIDFPRVPYPTDQAKFWELVRLGSELRQLHLLEREEVDNRITTYPEDGNNVVDKPRFELAAGATTGRVWINGEQYFDGVPVVAWEFYIGGYQPAQKWLKDRKGRELSFDDILHYQKIIVALTETDRLMKEVDVVGVV